MRATMTTTYRALLVPSIALALSFVLEPGGVFATPPDGPTQPDTQLKTPAEGEATTATIVFATTPAVTATVTWGRKLLGRITPGKPLVVVRPRDSGPVDVVVRATGYLPVQTRAHTFADTRVLVKLTEPEMKHELLGYRIPIDAGVEPSDGGTALDGASVPAGGTLWDAGLFQTVPSADAPSPWLMP